jgi:hypothetical protein
MKGSIFIAVFTLTACFSCKNPENSEVASLDSASDTRIIQIENELFSINQEQQQISTLIASAEQQNSDVMVADLPQPQNDDLNAENLEQRGFALTDYKEDKIKQLQMRYDTLEIRKRELQIELDKLVKLQQGDRSQSNIQKDISRIDGSMTAVNNEINATNTLSNAYPDCKAVLTAGKSLGSSYTDDWGSRQRSEGRWYVGCKAIASTCKSGEVMYVKGNTPYYGSVNYLSDDAYYVNSEKDANALAGSACSCNCR